MPLRSNKMFFYNFRFRYDFQIPSIKTVNEGKNYLRYFGPTIWNAWPIELRDTDSLTVFKREVRKWKPGSCTCRLCKDHVNGFVVIN